MKSMIRRVKQLITLATMLTMLTSTWAMNWALSPVAAMADEIDSIVPPCAPAQDLARSGGLGLMSDGEAIIWNSADAGGNAASNGTAIVLDGPGPHNIEIQSGASGTLTVPDGATVTIVGGKKDEPIAFDIPYNGTAPYGQHIKIGENAEVIWDAHVAYSLQLFTGGGGIYVDPSAIYVEGQGLVENSAFTITGNVNASANQVSGIISSFYTIRASLLDVTIDGGSVTAMLNVNEETSSSWGSYAIAAENCNFNLLNGAAVHSNHKTIEVSGFSSIIIDNATITSVRLSANFFSFGLALDIYNTSGTQGHISIGNNSRIMSANGQTIRVSAEGPTQFTIENSEIVNSGFHSNSISLGVQSDDAIINIKGTDIISEREAVFFSTSSSTTGDKNVKASIENSHISANRCMAIRGVGIETTVTDSVLTIVDDSASAPISLANGIAIIQSDDCTLYIEGTKTKIIDGTVLSAALAVNIDTYSTNSRVHMSGGDIKVSGLAAGIFAVGSNAEVGISGGSISATEGAFGITTVDLIAAMTSGISPAMFANTATVTIGGNARVTSTGINAVVSAPPPLGMGFPSGNAILATGAVVVSDNARVMADEGEAIVTVMGNVTLANDALVFAHGDDMVGLGNVIVHGLGSILGMPIPPTALSVTDDAIAIAWDDTHDYYRVGTDDGISVLADTSTDGRATTALWRREGNPPRGGIRYSNGINTHTGFIPLDVTLKGITTPTAPSPSPSPGTDIPTSPPDTLGSGSENGNAENAVANDTGSSDDSDADDGDNGHQTGPGTRPGGTRPADSGTQDADSSQTDETDEADAVDETSEIDETGEANAADITETGDSSGAMATDNPNDNAGTLTVDSTVDDDAAGDAIASAKAWRYLWLLIIPIMALCLFLIWRMLKQR